MDLIWVRNHLNAFKLKDFYKEMHYSHTSREKAEQKLQEILNLIKKNQSYESKLLVR
jgi:hypothetical protein